MSVLAYKLTLLLGSGFFYLIGYILEKKNHEAAYCIFLGAAIITAFIAIHPSFILYLLNL